MLEARRGENSKDVGPRYRRQLARRCFTIVANAVSDASIVEINGRDLDLDCADGRSVFIYLLSKTNSLTTVVRLHKQARVLQETIDQLRAHTATIETRLAEATSLPQMNALLAGRPSEDEKADMVRAVAKVVHESVRTNEELSNIRRDGKGSSLIEED